MVCGDEKRLVSAAENKRCKAIANLVFQLFRQLAKELASGGRIKEMPPDVSGGNP
jgi:hypothetical protein